MVKGLAALALVGALFLPHDVASAQRRDVLVFAAASLQTSLDALIEPATRATGVRMRISYAASSALARQIESGAPAGLFISADLDWMNYLDERKLVRRDSRRNLLGNRLVLIAPRGHAVSLAIGPRFPLLKALGRDRLAMAHPDAVPAGKYAKAALTSLGVWQDVEGRIAAAENVRAALLLVARGEAPLGVVYHTDAIAEPSVRIVGTFPADTHPPIVYPMALTTTAGADAAAVATFLGTPAARAVFERDGFLTFPPDGR